MQRLDRATDLAMALGRVFILRCWTEEILATVQADAAEARQAGDPQFAELAEQCVRQLRLSTVVLDAANERYLLVRPDGTVASAMSFPELAAEQRAVEGTA